MTSTMRGIVATALLLVLAHTGMAQDKTALATDRDKVSYAAGIDVAIVPFHRIFRAGIAEPQIA